jgi:hypothetical protein
MARSRWMLKRAGNLEGRDYGVDAGSARGESETQPRLRVF